MPIGTTALIGMAAQALGSGLSFAQSLRQKEMMRQANEAAAKANQEAIKALEKNMAAEISIQKEPYRSEREAMLVAGAQATEAGRESERGAAATAGRIYQQQQAGQADIAQRMGQEALGLEKLRADEASRLRDIGVQLNVAEIQGAQLAERQAQEQSAAALQAGIQGAIGVVQSGIAGADLYKKTGGAKQFSKLQDAAGAAGIGGADLQSQMANYLGDARLADMDPVAFQDYVTANVSPERIKDFQSKMGSQFVTNPFQSQVNLGPANDPMASALPSPFYDYGTGGVSTVGLSQRPTPSVIPQTTSSANIVRGMPATTTAAPVPPVVSSQNFERAIPSVIPQTAPPADIRLMPDYLTYGDIGSQPPAVEIARKPMPQMPALPGMSIQMAPRVYQQLPVPPPYITQGIPFPTF